MPFSDHFDGQNALFEDQINFGHISSVSRTCAETAGGYHMTSVIHQCGSMKTTW